jgi:hypothetical protein
MRRRLFNILAAVSLGLCLIMVGLWARSLGHFEIVNVRHGRWPRADEHVGYQIHFSWYWNTLRLEASRTSITPAFFRKYNNWLTSRRSRYPPGLQWEFTGEPTTLEMNGYSRGWAAHHYPWSPGPGCNEDRWELRVRPWLPTLLTAVLPAVWLYRNRRGADGSPRWRFGLRQAFVATTLVAVFLWLIIWLKS